MENTEKITESIAPFLGLFGALGAWLLILLAALMLLPSMGFAQGPEIVTPQPIVSSE